MHAEKNNARKILESEAYGMLEALSLVIFAGVMYFCLVVAPSVIEFFKSEEFKEFSMKHTIGE